MLHIFCVRYALSRYIGESYIMVNGILVGYKTLKQIAKSKDCTAP